MKDGQKNRESERVGEKQKLSVASSVPPTYHPPLRTSSLPQQPWEAQEVGGTLIGEDGLVVMAGAELVEWYQIHANPFAPFKSLL